jgi:hypothetical protein
MFLELKPSSVTPVSWLLPAIVCGAVLALLLAVLLIRRFHRLCTSKAVAFWNMTFPSEATKSRNGLSNEELDDILSTYDYSLEVPQAEYITCKSDFEYVLGSNKMNTCFLLW